MNANSIHIKKFKCIPFSKYCTLYLASHLLMVTLTLGNKFSEDKDEVVVEVGIFVQFF